MRQRNQGNLKLFPIRHYKENCLVWVFFVFALFCFYLFFFLFQTKEAISGYHENHLIANEGNLHEDGYSNVHSSYAGRNLNKLLRNYHLDWARERETETDVGMSQLMASRTIKLKTFDGGNYGPKSLKHLKI